MYEHQGLQSVFFVMLYGGALTMAVLAALYLLLRRSNAIEPDVNSPRELRLWAAAFLAAIAASHVWWYVLGIHWLTESRLVRNIVAITLDRITFVPLMMCVMLRLLQHWRCPLWPVAASMVPFVVIAGVSLATNYDRFEWFIECYSLLLCIVFFMIYVFELRQYGHWLRDNYADLEHKEIWQSLVLLACILLVYVIYTTNEGALATEVLAQILTLVIIAFVVWRVETLQQLGIEGTEDMEDTGKITNKPDEKPEDKADLLMESLLREHCEEAGLYLQHDLSLVQLAAVVGTNRTYLSSYFAARGETYNNYINRLRIGHFCQLYHQAIAEGRQFTAVELAQQSGYRSYSTFGVAFKQLTGQTVREWMQGGGKINTT